MARRCSCWTGSELLGMLVLIFVGAPALALGIRFFSWLGWSAPVAVLVVFVVGAFVVWAWKHSAPPPPRPRPRPATPPRPGPEPWPPRPGPGGPRSQAWWSGRS